MTVLMEKMSETNSTILIDEVSSNLAVTGASICMVLGTTVNVLAMTVILKRRPLREHNMSPVLFYQSFFDLTFCLLCLPFIIIRFTARENLFQVFPNTEKLCEWSAFLFYTNIAVCFWAKSIISLNRLSLVQRWDLKKHFSWNRTTAYYLVVLIFAVTMMSIPMSGRVWGNLVFNNETFTCNVNNDNSRKFLYAVAFSIPTVIMVLCFGFVAYKLRQLQMDCSFENQINRVSLLIFATFVVLYGPCAILGPLDPLEKGSKVPWLHVVFWFLAWCGSVVYPFIYIGSSQFYKREFEAFLYEAFKIGQAPQNPNVFSNALVSFSVR